MNLSTRTGFIRTLLVTVLIGLVAGCSTQTQINPEIRQESLLVKCPEVLPSDYEPTGAGWVLMMKEWSEFYHECRLRHNGLIDILKEN